MADRIVIMEKGRVQQVGSPREVYNNPKNLFVAGFIGSPSMNLLDATLSDDGGRVAGAGFDIALPERLAAAARRNGKKTLVAGLRPEHFASGETGGTQESVYETVPLDVQVAEYIGSSQFLAARIGGQQVTASIEVGPDAAPLTSGDYYFDTSRLYLFDKLSGEAVA